MIQRTVVALLLIILAAFAILFPKTEIFPKETINEASKTPVLTATNINYEPQKSNNYQEPKELTARSVAVVDEKTGKILFEKNANLKHLPASTTKLMTALISLEYCSPEETITVTTVEESGTQMGLEIGDRITVDALLHGLLISSGNDAAYALANNCGKSVKDFVSNMNRKASELSLENTHFTNPAGFDDDMQYSTAADLAELARVSTANPLIAKIVNTKSTVVTDTTGLRTYYLENVNKLLGIVDGVNGVKTGQTEGALEIVIVKTARNGNGIIVSVLGSQDRFGESKHLIEWAYENYIWPK